MGEQVSNGRDWDARFQDAALDPSQWLPVLQELADATGSSRAELIGIGSPAAAPFTWMTAIEPGQLDSFLDIVGYSPDINFRTAADARAKVLSVVHEAHYDEARRLRTGDDYLDFCEEFGIPHGCQASLVKENGTLIGLAALHTRKDGRTTEQQRAVFAKAVPAAHNAVRLQRAIEHQGFNILAGTLDAMSMPCLLLDGTGQVQAITPAAERQLAGQPILRLVDKRLTSGDDRIRRRIELALRSVLGPERQGHVRLPLTLQPPIPELVLDIFRLPAREWALYFAPQAMVVLRDPRPDLVTGARILAGAFELTPAEAQVALGLCEGHSRERIAAARGVSVETLRAQLKSIYLKTGCSRESELVLLLKALLD